MKVKDKNFVSAVIYIHNNEAEISAFFEVLISCMQKYFEHSEIICVNDFSTDESINRIKECAKNINDSCINITIINMGYYHGNENAMNIGIDFSIGDFVFEFDSVQWELQEDIIYSIYKKALLGYDILNVAPVKNKDYLANGFYYLLNRCTPLSYNVGTEVFRILSRRALNRIHDLNHAISYRKVNYAECGLKLYKEMLAVSKFKHCKKPDKQEKKYRHKLAINTLFINTNLALGYSVFVLLMNFLFIIFLIISTILWKLKIQCLIKPDLTLIVIAIIGFIILSLFTVVIKYQTIIIMNTYKRKQCSYIDIEKITK